MVILAYMASDKERLFKTREIASHTQIASPTVSKLLKNLAKKEILLSERGAFGGYRLSKNPDSISVLHLIESLEGPFAITECNLGHDACSTEAQCSLRTPWQYINQTLTEALSSIKLSDLTKPQNFMNGDREHFKIGRKGYFKIAVTPLHEVPGEFHGS